MKTLFLTIIAIFFAKFSFANVLIVNNNSNAPQGHYSNFQTAVDAANAGDTLYIVGSPKAYSENAVWYYISKKLTIIGTGYNPQKDSNYVAILNAHIILNGNSTGTKFIGIVGTGIDGGGIDSIEVHDCYFTSNGVISCITVHSFANVYHNIFNTPGGGAAGVYCTGNENKVYNNFFWSAINGVAINGCYFSNNFVTSSDGIYAFGDWQIQNQVIQNNIFYGSAPYSRNSSIENCAFNNNLTYRTLNDVIPYGSNTGQNNLISTNPLFVDSIPFTPVNYSLNYHLQPNSPANDAGTDGADLGPYGGSAPFLNFIGYPDIPQIISLQVLDTLIALNDSLPLHLVANDYTGSQIVAAEYFYDTDPGIGKGRPININTGDSLNINLSIFQNLLSGTHHLGVRVKSSKGNWSLPEMRQVDVFDIYIKVDNSPYTKAGSKEKYSITLINSSAKNFYDLFLVVRPTNTKSPNFGESIDTINSIDVSQISAITDLDSIKYVPIWLYNLPSHSQKSIDFYMETIDGKPHEILIQEFEIYYDFIDRLKPEFRVNGDTSDFKNSRLFSILYKTIYFEQNEISVFNIPDSTIIKKLDSNFKSIFGLFDQPQFVNKIIKPIFTSTFNVSFSDSLINIFGEEAFAFLRDSYFGDDRDEDEDSTFLHKIQRISCENPCDLNCETLPLAPLFPPEYFVVTSEACVDRCECDCVKGEKDPVGFEQTVEKNHGGYDIAISPKAPQNVKQLWNNSLYDVLSIYDGIVTKSDWENPGDHTSGFGWEVQVTTQCNGKSFTTIYGHLNPDYKLVIKGQRVAKGQVVGYAGQSGSAGGRHLHIEIRYSSGETCNPENPFSFFGYEMASNAGEHKCPPKDRIPCITEVPHMCFKKGRIHWGACQPTYIAANCVGSEFITPSDPNDKTGNKGFSAPQYITKTQQLHYGVVFQNKASASAPAQVVKIRDTLDKNKIDVSTLRVESITAGEMILVLPDSVHIQNLDTIYAKQPINGTFVHVQTTFDTATGILEFKMISLDTLTLQPVTNPLFGFLPPDTSNFNGNGLVSFKVMPKSTIADGTVIYNTAHIIFDGNAPIATGVWFNTIDDYSPSSNVIALPEKTYDTSFKVSWKGLDSGAGIIYYDIYYKKKDDSVYIKWISETSDTSAIFTGKLDSTYQFYSIAYDSLLNIEATPDTSDAITTVASEVLPLNLISFNANCKQNSIALDWITSNEISIKNYSIEKSMNASNWISTGKFVLPTNSQLRNHYHFTDPYNGYNYYRLRITDVDGKSSFSSNLNVHCGAIKNSMQAYPVPAANELTVLIQCDKSSNIRIVITDIYGKVIKKMNAFTQVGMNSFSLTTNDIPSGQYIVKAEADIILNSQKIIIIH